jgi:hypothetical protein
MTVGIGSYDDCIPANADAMALVESLEVGHDNMEVMKILPKYEYFTSLEICLGKKSRLMSGRIRFISTVFLDRGRGYKAHFRLSAVPSLLLGDHIRAVRLG